MTTDKTKPPPIRTEGEVLRTVEKKSQQHHSLWIAAEFLGTAKGWQVKRRRIVTDAKVFFKH